MADVMYEVFWCSFNGKHCKEEIAKIEEGLTEAELFDAKTYSAKETFGKSSIDLDTESLDEKEFIGYSTRPGLIISGILGIRRKKIILNLLIKSIQQQE